MRLHTTDTRGSLRAALVAGAALFVGMVLTGSAALAQTATNTATATVTATPTPTLGNAVPAGATDFAAFKYGGFRVATPVCPTPNSQTIIIPGLKQGDLIQVYPPDDYRGGISQRIVTNNTLRLNMACSTAGGGDWSYVWFNRAQGNCQGAPNCGPAATVTTTPTPTATP